MVCQYKKRFDVSPNGFIRNVCRLESLRLKFTNEPSIFVNGDMAESIKRSASDRLSD